MFAKLLRRHEFVISNENTANIRYCQRVHALDQRLYSLNARKFLLTIRYTNTVMNTISAIFINLK